MKLLQRYRLVDTLLMLIVAIVLAGPVFKIKYLDNWSSIESTFISDARILAGHMPHPAWQPLWYCGTRFDYIYPPALRYGTAIIALIGHVSTAKGYHIYIGLTYIFGLVSVYWLVIIGSGSRFNAWLSALAVALVSPSLLMVRELGNDSFYMVPQRLHVLMSYGEGPHISALSIIPAALAASFVALRSWRPAALALAGIFCALVVANNFYGATALAMFFPVVVWSVWVGLRNRMVWARAAAIVALAYGLSAFWLTPSYIRVTLMNMKWVSFPPDRHAQYFMLGVIIVYCDASFRWASRRPDRIWAIFVMGAAAIFSVDVLGLFYFNVRVAGEPSRLAPELDMTLLFVMALLITSLWKVNRLRPEGVILIILMFLPAIRYMRHIYSPFPRAANWETQYERRITGWVYQNLPGERVMPSGTNRFWYDAWFDNAQPNGGSDQGMLNQEVPISSFQVLHHENGEMSVLWLKALGTSAVIVPDQSAFETYHDYQYPSKFKGLIPAIYDDGHGTVIYRVPRIYKSLARVVDRAKDEAVGVMNEGDNLERLRQYVAVIEAPQPETPAVWSGFEEIKLNATVADGQSVLLQETYDPAWHAYENGRPLKIRPEIPMGFMLIDVPPGVHSIDMRFEVPLESRIGEGVLVVSMLVAGGLFWLSATPPHRLGRL